MAGELRLEGGKLLLFRRNGIWQARIYLGAGRYLWRSLKTSKQGDAKRDALRLLHETQFKLAEGLPVQTHSLDDVIDEYVGMRERDSEQGKAAGLGSSRKFTSPAMLRQIKRVSKFWREYAGKRAVDAIDNKMLSGYIPWRKTYYHGMAELPKNAKLNPTDKTLQWEMMLGKMLLKYANDQGYRANKPLPDFTFTPKLKRVRPAFTGPEYAKLCDTLDTWVKATDNRVWKYTRELLRIYVGILANSGMRVGEANNLRWRDVVPIASDDLRHMNVKFIVRGKTRERDVIPRIGTVKRLDRLRELRSSAPDEYVFAMVDGSQIITLIDQFNKVLELAGLTQNSAGDKYALYSLRHFYAVMAIENDIDIYTIARNMGTSVAMIEQYYGKSATPATRAARLGGVKG